MKFDEEGHLNIGPEEFARRLCDSGDNEERLVDEILLPGTPAMFPTHLEYCDFLKKVADDVGVHPSSIIICGSVRLGFSTTPRSGKVWRKWYSRSDIDLAIVDPDHYHLLDTEIRKWERTYRVSWDKLERLRANRGECCFRHDYLPKEVDIVKRYKDSMKKSKTGIVIQLLHSFIEIGGHFLHDVSMICANYAKGLKSIICHVLKCKREDARIILIKT